MEWETQGNFYGVHTISYSFYNHIQSGKNQKILTVDELKEGYEHAITASKTLNQPWENISDTPYIKNLLARNWFQVKNANAVFAIGKFVKNSTSLVDGGTGWAVQMAIDNFTPVYLFEQNINKWFHFSDTQFTPCLFPPTLTPHFAGIGTRNINENGKPL